MLSFNGFLIEENREVIYVDEESATLHYGRIKQLLSKDKALIEPRGLAENLIVSAKRIVI